MTDISEKLPINARYQYARLLYQYKKLSTLREANEFTGNIEFELYSFFEICYHLKDWMKSDCGLGQNIEFFITRTPALRITADICNRLKHCKLTSSRSKDLGSFSIHMVFKTGIGKDKVSISSAKIETERGSECCFALANECMRVWQEYISKL